ncbi:RNA polymerase factor sigma-54 [Peribacillus alkalitolerans]|uniref:RNA polymerase factor sigma-54 n=1 Tax=Peribacillus alkalitolerans TaxID=1550385 RepID=UPI0013D5F205|nr:RNA polymerase factor sigma-54 [Peribacillus alkalitolerans]
MNFNQGLFQQQSLKLSMTQELSQAIALLQYSSQELASFLESKSLENPLISVDSSSKHDKDLDFSASFNRKKKPSTNQDAKYWIEQISEEQPSLDRHLLSQIPPSLSKEDVHILRKLIQQLDENGYLRVSKQELSDIISVPIESIETNLKVLQSMDPVGVGAYNLQECLLLQAKKIRSCSELAIIILERHFLPLAEKKWKELAKELGISLIEIQQVFDFIQTLNPRPCSAFYHEKSSYIVPDVVVEWKDQQFSIYHSDLSIPSFSLNEGYYAELKKKQDATVHQFLQEKWQEYQWIAKGIQQRKETILRVVTSISEKQPEAMIKGLSFLKPMTMKDIADQLEVHESTVSRAVKEKYILAPFGTVEMRSFFSSNLQSTDFEDVSAEQAKREIENLIKNENKQKPLSDQDIADTLKTEHGIVLSRRTVAKYRDQLGIQSSSKRKRYE